MCRMTTGLVLLCLLSGVRADDKAIEKPNEKFEMTPDEKAVLDLTNAEREKEKLPPVKPNAILFKVARAHSENMARQQKLAHELDGKKPEQRVEAAGYKGGWVGENCAAGGIPYPPKEVLADWMGSPGHRGNILDRQYTEIGIGLAKGKDGQVYYTQVFARLPRR